MVKNEHLEEMKSLKAGDQIIVYNPNIRDYMTANTKMCKYIL